MGASVAHLLNEWPVELMCGQAHVVSESALQMRGERDERLRRERAGEHVTSRSVLSPIPKVLLALPLSERAQQLMQAWLRTEQRRC